MKYTLRELAALTGAQLVGDPEHIITGVENLDTASLHEAAFLENTRYEKLLSVSQAGVVFVLPSVALLPGKNFLMTPYPSLAFQKVLELFVFMPKTGFEGIHSTAVIHPEAKIGEGTTVGPHAVIDQGAIVGSHSKIGAGVFIGAETKIGSECILHANVVVREGCIIGNRVILQPGAVVGSCGYGYFTDAKGRHTNLKQLGTVILEDDVEIGANTTIDRARFKTTRICRGTKIDNLVQIGHQVELGENNLIVAQVGIAGSTKTGRSVVMGGQVGIAGHISIADNVMLAAKTGVTKSILESGSYGGIPAVPMKEAATQLMRIHNIPKLIQRLKDLEAKVTALEQEKSKQ